MGRKIAVIGSNSFSGSDFVDLLLEDHHNKIIGISRSPEPNSIFLPYKKHHSPYFQFFQIDFNRSMEKLTSLLDSFKPEYIVNFAALSDVSTSWKYPLHYYQTNTISTIALADYLKKVKYLRRFVHISTPEVYGTCRHKLKENSPLSPTTPYAASKAAADLFLFTLFKNYRFPLISVRSANVYGAHQQLHKIIPRSIIAIKSGRKIELHGGGVAIKTFIHIRDVSYGELAALTKGQVGEIYHLSTNDTIAIKDLVSLICQKLKVDFKQVTKKAPERLGQDKAYVISWQKAKKMLSWKPKISLTQGIDQVIDWINENWQTITHLPLNYRHKP